MDDHPRKTDEPEPMVMYFGEFVPESLRDHVEALVVKAPPPSAATLHRIAQLLRPGPARSSDA